MLTPERFPHLASVMDSVYYIADETPVVDTDDNLDTEYDLGLDLIISGLETMQRERSPHDGDE
ncbi:MAG TPA: hypothetical protein H9871_02190 [Candidatus Nesterenkonia stercoripullorum]|uniref:Uncharacterized protein n=1 Tax=Candidatus Nesterenkonia stercoripullorum TaxID=2838701 RepID=A0A9D1URF8_9MICC|nr:hypothetical protein [Candidatus Nesterenkonia stercoripullorum]